MKVLLVHNSYQLAGGEDQVVGAEAALLESRGECVLRYFASNVDVPRMSALKLAATTMWNQTTYREVRDLLRAHPETKVVHVHNTLPMISPAVYYAARDSGAAVVQTLHNYRLLCPSGTLFRDGRVCEDCLGQRFPVAGVAHGCYRGSRTATATVATMIAAHRMIGTWSHVVDLFIAPTEFARQKFVAGGLAADKIVVKPHFVHEQAVDHASTAVGEAGGDFALYVGRLSPEKGLATLLTAWERLGTRLPLKVVGDGPLAAQVVAATRAVPGVEWLGWQTKERVLALMRSAKILVFPSVCFETFGLAIAEAFSAGLPVVASDLGTMSSLVTHGETGLLFDAGDADDLVRQVEWVLAHPAEVVGLRHRARLAFQQRYTEDRNYEALMAVYAIALGNVRGRSTG